VNRRGGLGRGLAALIPPGEGGPVGSARASMAELPVDAIEPNPRQPRDVFDDDELEGLAASIRDMGLLQPVVVRPTGEDTYELIAGERRLRASKRAGLERIPAVVRHTEDADLLKEALVENIHRVQLNPLEEAAAYQQLLDDFDFTQEELAAKLGKSRPAISNTLRLLQLPQGVQRRVAAGVLSAGHAKALLALVDDPDTMDRFATRVVAEGMSVRALEELVRLTLLEPGDAGRARATGRPGKLTAPGLVELQDDLSDALKARVRISMGSRRGKLQVEFVSVDDLERIVGVIARGLEEGASVSVPGAAVPEPGTPDTEDPAAANSSAPAQLPAPTTWAEAPSTVDADPSGRPDPLDAPLPDLDLDEPADLADIDEDDLEALTRPD
jgi:ParB family transcriptional regulator, chromosome partitioning protein